MPSPPLRTAAAVLSLLLGTAAMAQVIAVRPGDTLLRLARAHGTTVEALQEVNGLHGDFLEAGQTLRLPGDPLIERYGTATVRVAPGDHLWGIAQAYGTTVAALMDANGLATDRLEVGQVLMIPNARLTTTSRMPSRPTEAALPTPATTPSAATPPAATPSAATPVAADAIVSALVEAGLQNEVGPGGTYRVEANDTLFAIANRYGVSLEALMLWNGLSRGDVIRVGQTLQLAAPQPQRIVVAAGDTLWSLASRNGVTLEALASANGIDPNAPLYVGRELRLPDGASSSANVGGVAPAAAVATRPAATEPPVRVAAIPPSAAMVWPVVGPITSRFGYRQLRIANTNMHSGIDISGRNGDPIRAATTGRVTFAGWRGGYGNLVIITQGNTEYWYAHASQLHVEAGEMVAAGEVIARVGETGNTTGPHLHFEIRVDGTAIDPLPILEARARR
jgi:murein DD-endopeptidase MepM/ murein hydrolase activator NlpD